MNITVKYTELTYELKKLTGYDIEFEFVADNTIKILKNIKIPIYGTTKIGIEVKVIDIDYLTLKVKTSSDILPKLIGLMPDLNISKYITIEKDVVNILLGNIEKYRKVFSYVRPISVSFDKTSLSMETTFV